MNGQSRIAYPAEKGQAAISSILHGVDTLTKWWSLFVAAMERGQKPSKESEEFQMDIICIHIPGLLYQETVKFVWQNLKILKHFFPLIPSEFPKRSSPFDFVGLTCTPDDVVHLTI